jgi:Tfp pilus assembly protein PilO
MRGHEPDSRYLTLWVCVIISSAIIFVGWFFIMKNNLQRIDDQFSSSDQTMEEAYEQVEGMFAGVKTIMSETQTGIEDAVLEESDAIEEIAGELGLKKAGTVDEVEKDEKVEKKPIVESE